MTCVCSHRGSPEIHVWDYGDIEKGLGGALYFTPKRMDGFEFIEIAQKVVEGTSSKLDWVHTGLFLLLSWGRDVPGFSLLNISLARDDYTRFDETG